MKAFVYGGDTGFELRLSFDMVKVEWGEKQGEKGMENEASACAAFRRYWAGCVRDSRYGKPATL